MNQVASSVSGAHVVARVAAALIGGYVFAWGLIALVLASLFAAGMPFHDAEFLASVLGLLGFLTAFLWAFAARRLLRVWLVLGGGGVLMSLLAYAVQAALV